MFVDIRADTLNIDETLIEAAITPRTKAIVPVHYAGVSCEMDVILDIAQRHGLMVIEDAAQGLHRRTSGRRSARSAIGSLSFHETKNIISGEGGALLVNDADLAERAEIIREKGTNRSAFFRGDVDKYTWVDLGSSFLPGEITAAFLWAQLEEARTSRGGGWTSGAAITRCWPTLEQPDCCAARSFPPIASTTATCITCCCHRWQRARK